MIFYMRDVTLEATRTPAVRQSGMKVKYVTTRPSSFPNLMFVG